MSEKVSTGNRYAHLKRGGSPGRPKGVPNKATQAIKAFASELLSLEKYKARLINRLETGKIHPAIEVLLYHYAYGKPRDVVQVEGSESLSEILQAALTRKLGGSDGDSE